MAPRLAFALAMVPLVGSCANASPPEAREPDAMACVSCDGGGGGNDDAIGEDAAYALDAGAPCCEPEEAADAASGEDAAPVDGGADACCALECDARLTHGPLLGAITHRSVKVWARTDGDAELGVVYWPAADPAGADFTLGETLDAATDYTGVVELSGLEPDTEYEYRLVLVGDTCSPEALPAQRFRTLAPPEPPAPLRFGFGADIFRSDAPVFDRVAAHSPAFMLLIGDNVYADDVPPTLDAYREKYREIWGGAQLRAFMAHIPVFMMWDDHEIINDYWAGKSDRFEPAAIAYDEYQHNHNPDPFRDGVRYYSFRASGVGFFVLDTRSYRSDNGAPDGPDKTMLGAEQKQDLLDWLAGSSDPVKIIASSVPFSDHGTTGNDSWRGFATERAEIFRFIWDNDVDGVLLVCGDQHWSGVFRLEGATPDEVLYELMPTPIAIHNRVAPSYESPEIVARDDDHEVYAVFDVDPTQAPLRIQYTLCDASAPCDPGNEPHPGSSLDLPPEVDNVPYGLELLLGDDGRFQLAEPPDTDADAGT